jgi:hypothetical protein
MKNIKKFLGNSIVKYELQHSLNYILVQNISEKLISFLLNSIKNVKHFSLNKVKLKCFNLNSFMNLKIFKFPLNIFIFQNFEDIKIFIKKSYQFIKFIKIEINFFYLSSFLKVFMFSPQFYIIFFKNNLLKLMKLQFLKKLA